LILDIGNEIKEFYDFTTRAMVDCEYTMDLLLSEILLYISDASCAEDGLNELRLDFERTHSKENGFHNDTEGLGLAAAALGRAIFNKLHALGVYAYGGALPYVHEGWLDENTPILKKQINLIKEETHEQLIATMPW